MLYIVGEGFQLRSKFAKANIAASRVVLNKYFLNLRILPQSLRDSSLPEGASIQDRVE